MAYCSAWSLVFILRARAQRWKSVDWRARAAAQLYYTLYNRRLACARALHATPKDFMFG